MREIIGTLAIMFFCIIAALAKDKSTEAIPLQRSPPKKEGHKKTAPYTTIK